MDMPRIDPASLKLAVIDQHIAEYRSAVRRDHNDEMAHFGLGIAYYNLRLHEEAIAEIEEAVRLMPENPHIQFQLAVMHSEQMTPRPFGQEPTKLEGGTEASGSSAHDPAEHGGGIAVQGGDLFPSSLLHDGIARDSGIGRRFR